MKTTNLRNTPIDRRRLSAEDRSQYKPSNRMQAVAKARSRKGQMAWNDVIQAAVGEFKKCPACEERRDDMEHAFFG